MSLDWNRIGSSSPHLLVQPRDIFAALPKQPSGGQLGEPAFIELLPSARLEQGRFATRRRSGA